MIYSVIFFSQIFRKGRRRVGYVQYVLTWSVTFDFFNFYKGGVIWCCLGREKKRLLSFSGDFRSLIQCAGHAGRDLTTKGEAILIVPPGVLRMGYGYENRRILELIVSIGNPFNRADLQTTIYCLPESTSGQLMETGPSLISKPSAKECSLIER